MFETFLSFYLWSIAAIGGIGTVIWTIFELLLIGSFFWAYIDEHKWQLPKKLEWFFFKYYSGEIATCQLFSEEEARQTIERINSDSWIGKKWRGEDHFGGRVMLVSFGYIGRVVLAWLIGIIWPLPVACAAVYYSVVLPLRSLRFARRSQKAIGQMAKVAHSHHILEASVKHAGIKEPKF